MSPHSWQPCAVVPAVQCCSPSPMVLTALLPTTSPPCHSWDGATKWPLNSSTRGEPQSLLQKGHSLPWHIRAELLCQGTIHVSEKVLPCARGLYSSLTKWDVGEGTSTSSARPGSLESGVSWRQWQNNKSTGCFYKYLPKSFNGMTKLGIIWDTKMKLLKLNLNTSLKEKTLQINFIFLKLNSNRTMGYFKESYFSVLVPLNLWKMPSAPLSNLFLWLFPASSSCQRLGWSQFCGAVRGTEFCHI